MPYESPEEADARRAEKAERARDAFARQQARIEAAEARLLADLAGTYLRGVDEVAALMRISARAAADVVRRPDFPRPRSPHGDRIRLWKRSEVEAWVDAQIVAEAE